MATSQTDNKDESKGESLHDLHSSSDYVAYTYADKREEVSKLIDSFIEFASTDDFITHIRDDGYDMNALTKLFTTRKKDLMADCAIVVAGETSAGKSTLINRIIGENKLLPTSLTASTKRVCRISYSSTYSVTTRDNNNKKLEKLEVNGKDDMAKTLKEKGDVIIVDTPGIADKEQETVAQIMLDYIQNALAIMFVLNVANAGGIQHDRVARVINHVRDSFSKMPCFCPKDTIFVLNKWDVILDDDDEEEFLEKTKAKIHELWEEIDDECIMKLSAKKASAEYLTMFEDFQKALAAIITRSENKRIEIHLDFLENYLKECDRVVSTKLRFSGLNKEESENNLYEARRKLLDVTQILEKAKLDLQHTIDKFVRTASEKLHCFLQTEAFRTEIISGTDKITRFKIEEKLNARIEAAINRWQRTHIEDIFLDTFMEILGERFTVIHEKLHMIKNDMQGLKTNFAVYPKIKAVLSPCIGYGGLFGSLVVDRSLGRRYLAVGVAAVGIVSGLLVAGLDALDILDDFETIRKKAFKAVLDTLSKEAIQERMRKSYENDIKTIITFWEGNLQDEINNLNKNIDTMLGHLDEYKRKEATLQSLSSTISKLTKNLKLIGTLNGAKRSVDHVICNI